MPSSGHSYDSCCSSRLSNPAPRCDCSIEAEEGLLNLLQQALRDFADSEVGMPLDHGLHPLCTLLMDSRFVSKQLLIRSFALFLNFPLWKLQKKERQFHSPCLTQCEQVLKILLGPLVPGNVEMHSPLPRWRCRTGDFLFPAAFRFQRLFGASLSHKHTAYRRRVRVSSLTNGWTFKTKVTSLPVPLISKTSKHLALFSRTHPIAWNLSHKWKSRFSPQIRRALLLKSSLVLSLAAGTWKAQFNPPPTVCAPLSELSDRNSWWLLPGNKKKVARSKAPTHPEAI